MSIEASHEKSKPGAAFFKGVRKPGRLIGPVALSRIGFLIGVLAIWEIALLALDIPKILVPPPSDIFRSLASDLTSPRMYWHIWVTLKAVLGGFVLGAGGGFLLGCLLGRFIDLQRLLYPYVVAFETIPKVAIAPLIVVWFGFGISSKIVTAGLICFFPVVANTVGGLRTTPRELSEMAVAFTASRGQLFWKVKLPHALPYVFSGLEIGIVMAVIGAIVAEFVGAQAGLGYMILQRQFSLDIAGVFSILVILSVIGIVLNQLVRLLQRRIVFWVG